MKNLIFALVLACIHFASSASAQTACQPLNTIYVIHGYAASTDDHWFESLKQQLEDAQTKVILIPMPDSAAPQHAAWQQSLQQTLQQLDQHSYLVAHSLGAISLLHYLAQQPPAQLAALVLVSPFKQKLVQLPQLDQFIQQASQLDLNTIKHIAIAHLHIYLSDDDRYVEPALSLALAKQLASNYSVIQGAGHFLKQDGYSQFEQLSQQLKAWLDSDRAQLKCPTA